MWTRIQSGIDNWSRRNGAKTMSAGVTCVLLATSMAAAGQQELSLAEHAKRALLAKQSRQTAPERSGPEESLAEQARQALRAEKSGQTQPVGRTEPSLGAQAKLLAQERNLYRSTLALRGQSPVPLVFIVRAPAPQEPTRITRGKRGTITITQTAVRVLEPAPPVKIKQTPQKRESLVAEPVLLAQATTSPIQAISNQSSERAQPYLVQASAPMQPYVASPSNPQSTPQHGTQASAQPQSSEPVILPRADLHIQTAFKVKYVGQDIVYLSGGRGAGLAEGMKLTIKRRAGGSDAPEASGTTTIAKLEVASVAASSAVCEVRDVVGEIRAGDIAYLSESDAEALAQTRAVGGLRKYPQVVTFSEGDPLEEEAREDIPRPPLPEVNRARGRIGLDYSGINSRGSVASSSYQLGGAVRADITRIGGTYWNLSGYWRGRLNSSSYAGQETLQDLINRTYHLSMTYDSPKSNWVAGFGRLYLPWASSLDTLDGGYVGRKLGHGVTAGVFAGSTPDPTSWDYNPDRRIAGSFVNVEGGSFDSVHYSSTSGIALASLGWVLERPFLFFENGIFFKRYFSVYQSAQVDDPRPAPGVTKAGAGLSRSYITVRFQPHRRISFDVNHNYFRDVPTFSTQLIGTGLVDKYLFQGLSAGVRVEPVRHITLYADLGRSSRSGDQKDSWNQLYGISWDRIWKTGLRADLRASKFDSSFGSGSYRSLALSRNFGDHVHWQVQGGRQTLVSSFTGQNQSRFVNSSIDASFGRHYYIQGDFTTQRGGLFDYDQWVMTFGYRFDNRSKTGGVR